MMLTHKCPFCGKEHERDTTPEPMSKACPECWTELPHSFVVLDKKEWARLLDIIISQSDAELEQLYESIARQVYPDGDEIIAQVKQSSTKARFVQLIKDVCENPQIPQEDVEAHISEILKAFNNMTCPHCKIGKIMVADDGFSLYCTNNQCEKVWEDTKWKESR